MLESALALLVAAEGEGGGRMFIFLIQIVAIFAIFYYLLIRPQKKEQERHRDMVERLQKGDEIITAGGVVGTVVHAEPDRLTIRSAENTRLVIDRSKVAHVVEDEGGAGGGKEKAGGKKAAKKGAK